MELAAFAGAGVLIGVAVAIIIALLNRPRQERSDFKAESLQRILERHERDRVDE